MGRVSARAVDAIEQGLVAAGVPRDKARARALADASVVELVSEDEQRARDERLEKAIELEGDKQLRALGFEVVKFSHPGKTKQTPGIPDRRYYHRGRRIAFWWEAKSATGAQRPDQRIFQEMCDAVGDPYVLGTDQDLFAWLIAQRIAVEEGGLLVPLPYSPQPTPP